MSTVFGVASKLPCAIATIRLSGNLVLKSLALITSRLIRAKEACVLRIKTERRLWDCVITWRPCPNSPTGEDYAEISVVGSEVVVNSLTKTLIRLSLLQAKGGEFTKRAMVNNKLNTSDVLKLAKLFGLSYDVCKATCLARQVDKIIIGLEAQHNLGIGFELKAYKLKSLLSSIKQLRAFNLLCVCFVGRVNAGKSSLSNALTRSVFSITSNLQGTTRDVVRAREHSLEVLDTAGFKRAVNKVDTLALASTYNAMSSSIIIALLCSINDNNAFVRCRSLCAVILVVSKLDLIHKVNNNSNRVFVSAYTLEGITSLRQSIEFVIRHFVNKSDVCESALLQTSLLLTKCLITNSILTQIELLMSARATLVRASNKLRVYELLNRFCVGK